MVFAFHAGVTAEEKQVVEEGVREARQSLEDLVGWRLTGELIIQVTDSPGPPTATASPGTNSIIIRGGHAGWSGVSSTDKKRVIGHEYLHIYQARTGWTRTLWVTEGSAEVFGYQSAWVRPGVRSRQHVRECYINTSLRTAMPPLLELTSLTEGDGALYSYAAIAADYLIGDDFSSLAKLESGGTISVFGRSVEEFYAAFEEYKRTWVAKPALDCRH